jgi:HEAT repeat protein
MVELAVSADDPEVRVRAAKVLAQAGALTEPVTAAATDLAVSAENWQTRQAAANVLQEAEPTLQLLAILLSLFRDPDNDVRRTAGNTLVELGRRHPDVATEVQDRLAHACQDSCFDGVDQHERRSGWDYAYDALWTMTELLAS